MMRKALVCCCMYNAANMMHEWKVSKLSASTTVNDVTQRRQSSPSPGTRYDCLVRPGHVSTSFAELDLTLSFRKQTIGITRLPRYLY
jgi:hypothetical protein